MTKTGICKAKLDVFCYFSNYKHCIALDLCLLGALANVLFAASRLKWRVTVVAACSTNAAAQFDNFKRCCPAEEGWCFVRMPLLLPVPANSQPC